MVCASPLNHIHHLLNLILIHQRAKAVFRRGRIRRRFTPQSYNFLPQSYNTSRKIRNFSNFTRRNSTCLGCMHHAGVFCRVIRRRITLCLNAPLVESFLIVFNLDHITNGYHIGLVFFLRVFHRVEVLVST